MNVSRASIKLYLTNGVAIAATAPEYVAPQSAGGADLAFYESLLKCAVLAATLLYTLVKSWKLATQKSSGDTVQIPKGKD